MTWYFVNFSFKLLARMMLPIQLFRLAEMIKKDDGFCIRADSSPTLDQETFDSLRKLDHYRFSFLRFQYPANFYCRDLWRPLVIRHWGGQRANEEAPHAGGSFSLSLSRAGKKNDFDLLLRQSNADEIRQKGLVVWVKFSDFFLYWWIENFLLDKTMNINN